MLALAGRDPDDTEPYARAGAMLVAEALHIHRVANTKKT